MVNGKNNSFGAIYELKPCGYEFVPYNLDRYRSLGYWVLDDFAEGGKVKSMLDSGYGLFVNGNVGSGKTTLAVASIRYLYKQSHIIESNDLLDELRESIQEHETASIILKYKTIPVLVIDDFGVESTGSWGSEKMYSIINHRWLYKDDLVTIVTSNYNPDELITRCNDKIVGQRIISRLKGMCKRVEIKENDRR